MEEQEKRKKSGGGVGEEDEDCFYESLDRILSSSNSSTSASDDDDVLLKSSSASPNHRRHRYRPPTTHADSAFNVPKLPVSAENYGDWIKESFSCSVEQRRDRLLRALGLAGDPSLSRLKLSSVGDRRSDFYRSVSADQFSGRSSIEGNSGGSAIVRSKSEGSTDCQSNQCNLFVPSTSIISSHAASHTVYNNNSSDENSNNNKGNSVVNYFACNGLSPGLNKLRIKRVNEILGDSTDPCTDTRGDGCGHAAENVGSRCLGDDASARMCTIKNLDNGKEFVVNEVREDGMWNKLREVGTGRQLTMEEFEICVGHSPIVQELMRRQNVEGRSKENLDLVANGNSGHCSKMKKKVGWLNSIKSVASSVRGNKERRSSDEKDTSSEKGGPRSSSATDDSQDVSFHGPEKVRVRQYGKSVKEMSALYKSEEIQAHNGSIWTIKFSLDGRFLASAGEDCAIHVWQVVESERKGDLMMDRPDDGSLNLLFMSNGSPEPTSLSPNMDNPVERKRRGRASIGRKSLSVDHVVVPEMIFGISEKPICSFLGHLDDVLDLSWSKSQLLLSSSMDKTVRLWDLPNKTCLKVFSHSDYVTCIQFNPVDDRYFISGSLDAKVRIWSIPDHQVVDWNDLHEMVTAACYTPDGQGALVGSYKGSCRVYNTSENKLLQKGHINLQNKKKKSHLKKITGFQFAPGSSSEVLITSADSRIRVIDGVDMVHKFKGFRNTNSQISAAVSANGKYVVSASEDSHVYVWKHEGDSPPPGRSKGVTVTRSYEHFHCQDISVAIPWPGIGDSLGLQETCPREHNGTCLLRRDEVVFSADHPPTPVEGTHPSALASSGCGNSPLRGTSISSATHSYFFDRFAATSTWPEEKLLLATKNPSPQASLDFSNGLVQRRSAWGMVIVTAGLRGKITTFQNFGLPVRM